MFLLRFLPFVAVAVVAALFKAGSSGDSPSITSINNAPRITPGGGVSITHAPPGPTSYLTSGKLRAGLARVQRLAPGSKLLLLRIDSSSLAATVAPRHGQAREILLTPSGTLNEPAGSPGSLAISFSQIDPAVPQRLTRELRTRFHVPESRISYLVAFSFQGLSPSWGVYLKNDTNYQASLSGAGLHKNG